jgi:hypothetical protein
MRITITKSEPELYTLTDNDGLSITGTWNDLKPQIDSWPPPLTVGVKKQVDACGWALINMPREAPTTTPV